MAKVNVRIILRLFLSILLVGPTLARGEPISRGTKQVQTVQPSDAKIVTPQKTAVMPINKKSLQVQSQRQPASVVLIPRAKKNDSQSRSRRVVSVDFANTTDVMEDDLEPLRQKAKVANESMHKIKTKSEIENQYQSRNANKDKGDKKSAIQIQSETDIVHSPSGESDQASTGERKIAKIDAEKKKPMSLKKLLRKFRKYLDKEVSENY